ncbi:MAG TPA: hypothetical protein VMZ53_03550 [Kofleriaceae bacterium]|nr:hypothetical protein [Kofleriaceae bacterium]
MTPIELWKGESRTLTVTVVHPDTGFPVDLSAGTWQIDTLEFQIKSDVEAADPALVSKSLVGGITLLTQSGDTLGQAEIEIDPADTQSITPGVYKYDVVAVFTNAKRVFVIKPSDLQLYGVVNGL